MYLPFFQTNYTSISICPFFVNPYIFVFIFVKPILNQFIRFSIFIIIINLVQSNVCNITYVHYFQTFIALISIDMYFLCVIIFILANISLHNCVCIGLLLVNWNIFLFVFVLKMGFKYFHICIFQKMSTWIYSY